MQHLRLVFMDLRATAQEARVKRTRRDLQQGHIAFAGQQQAEAAGMPGGAQQHAMQLLADVVGPLRQLEGALQNIRSFSAGISGNIAVGMTPTVAYFLAQPLLERMAEIVGPELAAKVREISLRLYSEAAAFALQRGIIIADTKFEFGLDAQGTLTLMDEILTPDSSRFWPVEGYQEGSNPPSYDKQFVRDWLERATVRGQPWNKTAPAPKLDAEVIQRTAAKYQEAKQRLLG